jgi:hypothetical protein
VLRGLGLPLPCSCELLPFLVEIDATLQPPPPDTFKIPVT